MRVNLVITKFLPLNTPSMLLRTYLSNVTPQQGPVQYIPVVSVIVAQERPAAARNRGKENLKRRSFSCASTEGNGSCKCKKQKLLPPKQEFIIPSRLWKKLQFFFKFNQLDYQLNKILNARICTLEQTERRGCCVG